jgi:hypothetical protein
MRRFTKKPDVVAIAATMATDPTQRHHRSDPKTMDWTTDATLVVPLT